MAGRWLETFTFVFLSSLIFYIHSLVCSVIYSFIYIFLFLKFNFTVDSRYLDFGYLEQPLISKRKSDPCLSIEL